MNTSGIEPLDVRVLVLPDEVKDKTAGGIFIPETAQEKEKYATVKGTLIALGANAFAEASVSTLFKAPQPGDRVMIAKYGGVNTPGKDGKEYRLLNDVDVVAKLEGM